MSGRHKWSELKKHLTPEQKRYIEKKKAEAIVAMDREIHIEPIELDWSEWHSWTEIGRSVHDGGVNVPDEPGVYEVRIRGEDSCLTIGRSKRLRARIKSHLVRDTGSHSAGERIRTAIKTGIIDSRSLVIRWAVTNRYAVAEAALHERHLYGFGELPKYTKSV